LLKFAASVKTAKQKKPDEAANKETRNLAHERHFPKQGPVPSSGSQNQPENTNPDWPFRETEAQKYIS
jgi:hypothetical protein